MCALFLPAAQYPHAFLDIAWRNVVLNSAHDSSCACSDDEVVDHVLVRYREARQIGDGLVRDALHALGERGRRAAGRDRRREPDRSGRDVASSRASCRVRGPCHFVGPDGAELADAG